MSRETTVRDLIERLEEVAQEHGDDTPIRIAEQPTYPLQNYIDDDIRFWKGVLYLKHANQVGGYSSGEVLNDSPYLPRHIFGDPPEEQCDNCGSYAVVGTVLLGGQADREYICSNCLRSEVPTSVAETYEGDLPLQMVMDGRAADPGARHQDAIAAAAEGPTQIVTPS
jgi:hypothetical protein